MSDNLLHFSLSPIELIIRAAVVYIAILILLRISGKRQVGQMGATEFVAILLISNAVQNSMNGGDNSLAGGLLLAFILIFLSTSISYLTYRSRFFATLFEGTPRLIIHNGAIIERALKRELLSHAELRMLLRKQGIHNIHEIRIGILEPDGTLSVTKYSETSNEPIQH